MKNNKQIIFNNLTSAVGKLIHRSCSFGNQLLEHPLWIKSISALAIQPRHLLGTKLCFLKILVRKLPDGRELWGRIVETEAYLGGEDEASHSKGGKQTQRNAAMFMKPGTLYVYQIYGIYFCMNVSSQGEGAAVLLRSLEPLQGLDAMRELRRASRKAPSRLLKDWQLCNGPSKLCQAFGIDKAFDQRDLTQDEAIWMVPGQDLPGEQDVVTTTRIGIGNTGEWAHKPLRFYLRGNRFVSVVDKKMEREMAVRGHSPGS
ncbi:DNA-3-methyladenine glycosylase isoform X2 [Chamaea fasciata]|uniref:DNA-3-methyladenine glycosylase isoform X2 n=1 Tax=Chamaea fasciata TaxID=190680 RepID=UPI00336A61CB